MFVDAPASLASSGGSRAPLSFPGPSDKGQLVFLVPWQGAFSAIDHRPERPFRPAGTQNQTTGREIFKGQAHLGKDPRMTTVGF